MAKSLVERVLIGTVEAACAPVIVATDIVTGNDITPSAGEALIKSLAGDVVTGGLSSSDD